MKRLILSVMVLCVVAPASFGAYLDEYTWVATSSGNFTDATWTCKTGDPAGATSRPAVPYESANTTDWTNYARPDIGNGTNITINTDIAPLDLGFAQFQIKKGTVTVDNGGEFRIHTGYIHMSTNSQASGLIVQNGGKYINTGTMSSTGDNQRGTLLTYTTTNALGFVTISGADTLFDTKILFGGRAGQTQVRYGQVNVLGSGSTINTEVVGPGGNNLTISYNFTTDAGGVSAINVGTSLAFQQGVALSHTANVAKLSFVLGAAPTEGQVFTLFDLDADAVRTGLMKTTGGTALVEKAAIHSWFGDTQYWFELSYKGGETGNDVILTAIPEPATIGLLSLGGLVLARRRRA